MYGGTGALLRRAIGRERVYPRRSDPDIWFANCFQALRFIASFLRQRELMTSDGIARNLIWNGPEVFILHLRENTASITFVSIPDKLVYFVITIHG